MASSALQKQLLRIRTRPASSALFTHFHKQPLSPSPPFALTQTPKPVDPIPERNDRFSPSHSFCGQFYPSFSFESLLLNAPVAPPSVVRAESDGETDEGSVIRADSVKKKRRKKMRKHKVRKMKKLLRRKTRS